MEGTISIIVPVYNAEKTLNRCVKSLTEQTYDNIEILLVNDGSKDHSLQLCREWEKADNRVKVIDKPNGGASSARNAGLEKAAGEFVMFCDSDDHVSPFWCELLYKNTEPGDLVLCEIAHGYVPQETQLTISAEIVERSEYMHHYSVMSSPCNKMFQLQVIRDNGLHFTENLHMGEDLVFAMRYLCCIPGRVHILPLKLYFYDTSSEQSLSKRSIPMEQCDLFYRQLTESMKKIGAMDPQSIYNRDLPIMSHFENLFISISQDRSLSVGQKLREAQKIGALDSFQSVSGRVISWENPFFSWLLVKKYTRLIMCYLMLRDMKTRIFHAERS